jgi:hypothetical protein
MCYLLQLRDDPMPRTLALLPILSAALAAQNTFIVPAARAGPRGGSTATNRGTFYDSTTFWHASTTPVQPVRTQMLWDVTDIPVQQASLLSMSFRRANSVNNFNPAATAILSIHLSVGPNNSGSRSAVFANNLGALVTNVFNGTINLPPDGYSGPGAAPFNVVIPFMVPFTYSAPLGHSLVADLNVTSYTSTGSWYLDVVQPDYGLRNDNLLQPSCRFSNGNFSGGLLHRNPVLGYSWLLSYSGLPTGMPGVGFMGFQGINNTWNGIPLPFSLAPLGAPGCSLAISLALGVALTESSPGNYTWPQIPIPNDPLLYDAAFYDEAFFVDPAANALGVAASWSSKWTIRSNAVATGQKLYNHISNGQPFPSGSSGLSLPDATIAQFSY